MSQANPCAGTSESQGGVVNLFGTNFGVICLVKLVLGLEEGEILCVECVADALVIRPERPFCYFEFKSGQQTTKTTILLHELVKISHKLGKSPVDIRFWVDHTNDAVGWDADAWKHKAELFNEEKEANKKKTETEQETEQKKICVAKLNPAWIHEEVVDVTAVLNHRDFAACVAFVVSSIRDWQKGRVVANDRQITRVTWQSWNQCKISDTESVLDRMLAELQEAEARAEAEAGARAEAEERAEAEAGARAEAATERADAAEARVAELQRRAGRVRRAEPKEEEQSAPRQRHQ
eukprot:TRINITY_DN3215_c0_g1_i3.p1 TRINITY_DN3215_c0_g1~~TRINITY_DN3215_c0_g1_i3.p1  ORF type:complete len:293 (-),score=71.28 TRINITY_DN3215_c0_g1_i3:75-953(-)